MRQIAPVLLPALVGFLLSEIGHLVRGRQAERSLLDAEHRRRQVDVLAELRNEILEFGDVVVEHLWAGWQVRSSSRKFEEQLARLFDAQEAAALRLFALCAEVDDPWIRHRVDYLEEHAREAVLDPGSEFFAGGESRVDVAVVRRDADDIERRVILINNLIGSRLLALSGGRRMPEYPEDNPVNWRARAISRLLVAGRNDPPVGPAATG